MYGVPLNLTLDKKKRMMFEFLGFLKNKKSVSVLYTKLITVIHLMFVRVCESKARARVERFTVLFTLVK